MAAKPVCEKSVTIGNTKRMPHVTEATDRLAVAVTGSEEAVTSLGTRIESVCSAAPPSGCDKKAEPGTSVKLAEVLNILALRIESNTARIRDIESRVEL